MKTRIFSIFFASLLVFAGCEYLIKLEKDEIKEIPKEQTVKTIKTDEPEQKTYKGPERDFTVNKIPKYFENGDIEFSGVVEYMDPKEILSEQIIQIPFYKVGKIKKDPYKGWDLLVAVSACEGMCWRYDQLRFAWNANTKELIYLENHSSLSEYPEYEPYYRSETIEPLLKNRDSITLLKGLEPPKKIKIPDTNIYLKLNEADTDHISVYLSGVHGEKENIAFTDPQYGDVYDDNRHGCLRIASPDGSFSRYAYDPGFFTNGGDYITWNNNGSKIPLTGNYVPPRTGGCMGGDDECYYINSPISEIPEENLKHTGTTSKGIDFYEIEDAEIATRLYENNYYENYKAYFNIDRQQKDKVNSFEEYLKTHPILYWKDPLGRWSHLVGIESQSMAECAKPVIYLYPEEKTDVKVQVNIEKITEAIPEYQENGWSVSAYPNGEIYNYTDGEIYPYLFWEGYSGKSINLDKGFVVERENIMDFVDSSLDKMGLNSKEKADFLEFWEPKILKNDEPYFFITFLGTKDFNKVAPLTINPVPDTLIRVFMYYEPLEEKYDIAPLELKSIKRRGFTVVEWGGTSPAL